MKGDIGRRIIFFSTRIHTRVFYGVWSTIFNRKDIRVENTFYNEERSEI